MEKEKVTGIVTAMGEDKARIWTRGIVDELEWKWKRRDPTIELGSWVEFEYDKAAGRILNVHRQEPVLETRVDRKNRVQVRTLIVFPPPEFATGEWEQLAWSYDFERVGVYRRFADRQDDVVFDAWVTRLPEQDLPSSDSQYETWCLHKQPLIKADNQELVNKTPWHRRTDSPIVEDFHDSVETIEHDLYANDFQLIDDEPSIPSVAISPTDVPANNSGRNNVDVMFNTSSENELFIGVITGELGGNRSYGWGQSTGSFLVPGVKLSAGDWVHYRVFESADNGDAVTKLEAYFCEPMLQPVLPFSFIDGVFAVVNQKSSFAMAKSEDLGFIELPLSMWMSGRRRSSPLECWVVKKADKSKEENQCAWRAIRLVGEKGDEQDRRISSRISEPTFQSVNSATFVASQSPVLTKKLPLSVAAEDEWVLDMQGIVVGEQEKRWVIFSLAGYGTIGRDTGLSIANGDTGLSIAIGKWVIFSAQRKNLFEADLLIAECEIIDDVLPVFLSSDGILTVKTTVTRWENKVLTVAPLGIVVDEKQLVPNAPGDYEVQLRHVRESAKKMMWLVIDCAHSSNEQTKDAENDFIESDDSLIDTEGLHKLHSPSSTAKQGSNTRRHSFEHNRRLVTDEMDIRDKQPTIDNVRGLVMKMTSNRGFVWSRLTQISVIPKHRLKRNLGPGTWVEFDVIANTIEDEDCHYEVCAYEKLEDEEGRCPQTRIRNGLVEILTKFVVKPDVYYANDNVYVGESVDVGRILVPRHDIDRDENPTLGSWIGWINREGLNDDEDWMLCSTPEKSSEVLARLNAQRTTPHHETEQVYTSDSEGSENGEEAGSPKRIQSNGDNDRRPNADGRRPSPERNQSNGDNGRRSIADGRRPSPERIQSNENNGRRPNADGRRPSPERIQSNGDNGRRPNADGGVTDPEAMGDLRHCVRLLMADDAVREAIAARYPELLRHVEHLLARD